ncbi:perilipin 6 [Astyanax mexicanus]|uniref:perilipin 6 n=1 Tax=Astyanax mexicanus TaxID=7994 RepID=UPI0020CADECE|nr:perilipin 6 [Astyanax mexicanus]
MSETTNSEGNALKKVVKLPLVSSAFQMVGAMYVGVKRRYPLLGIVGGVTELSVRSISSAASQRTAPLLERLEPEIGTVNSYALVGLEQLEKSFPILHQSAEEVIERLKDTFFLRLDDVQSRVNVELDGMVDRWEKVLKFTWEVLEAAQATSAGQALTAGLDELLSRSEEAVDYYLPLPPTLQREWEIRVQSYEDEEDEEDDDDDDREPRMWMRIRCLLLCLYLQMYHRFQKLKERVNTVLEFLGEAAEVVGLTGLLEGVWSLLQLLLSLYTAQVQRVQALQSLILAQFSAGVQALKEFPTVQQLLTLPDQVRTVMDDLLELGQILIQLLINTTPLYDLIQQSSDQNMPEFELPDGASPRSSGNSLFLKAMDGRPRRRRSLYARYARRSSASGSAMIPSLAPTPSPAAASTPAPTPVPAKSISPVSNLESTSGEAIIPDPAKDLIPDPVETQDELPDPQPNEIQEDPEPEPEPEPEPTEDEEDLQPNENEDDHPEPETTENQVKTPDRRKGSLKQDGQRSGSVELDSPVLTPSNMIRRRSSTREVLFSPIMQFVTQSQRAFEYLSSGSYTEDQVIPVIENSEQ